MAGELRWFAKSEQHLALFQPWLDSAAPKYSIQTLNASSDKVEGEDAAQRLFSSLKTTKLGNLILHSSALPSTQILLHDELKPHPPADVLCYTQHQVSGKGRGSNTWTSPEGCLTFSFTSRFTDGAALPFVQYLVSLAIVRAVKDVAKTDVAENPVRIKWPNDIYANNAKIGGILCQSEYSNGEFRVTTGVGLNISNDEPTTCIQKVLGTNENPCTATKEEFLAAFCNAYEPMQETFQKSGFEPFMKEYVESWLHSDQVVQVQSSESADTVSAVIKGLTASGCLLADADGKQLELYPDGNSLDFFQGLLTRKL